MSQDTKTPGGAAFLPLPRGERVGVRGDRAVRLARNLRAAQTDAEAKLWYYLRSRRLAGAKFKRQVPIGRYVADFLCADRRLIVEVDGSQHITNAEADAGRTREIEGKGYLVIRFWNNDVLTNIEGVVQEILAALQSPASEPPHPDPLPPGEREKNGKTP